MNSPGLPVRVPEGKVRYKATYRDPNQNPFRPLGIIITVPTKTVDIDASVPLHEVEEMAREACESYELVSVKAIS